MSRNTKETNQCPRQALYPSWETSGQAAELIARRKKDEKSQYTTGSFSGQLARCSNPLATVARSTTFHSPYIYSLSRIPDPVSHFPFPHLASRIAAPLSILRVPFPAFTPCPLILNPLSPYPLPFCLHSVYECGGDRVAMHAPPHFKGETSWPKAWGTRRAPRRKPPRH